MRILGNVAPGVLNRMNETFSFALAHLCDLYVRACKTGFSPEVAMFQFVLDYDVVMAETLLATLACLCPFPLSQAVLEWSFESEFSFDEKSAELLGLCYPREITTVDFETMVKGFRRYISPPREFTILDLE